MNNQRLIDGNKLLDALQHNFRIERINDVVDLIMSGEVDAPSNQGESKSLRDDITEAINIWECMAMDDDPVDTIERVIRTLREAISLHTEDTGIQKVQTSVDEIIEHCSSLDRYDSEEHNSPDCVNELSLEDQSEVEEWVAGMLRDCSRMTIDMYLDEQGIIPGVQLRPEVQWFAEQMELTLRRNDHKGGWKECTREYLLGRMESNYHSLWARQQAYGALYDIEGSVRKSANIANFAMMIADNARRLPPGINTDNKAE